MIDAELRKVFLDESREILENLESEILSLEEQFDPELLNTVFRHIHTLKGSSGVAGFDRVYEFAHQLENLLDRLRSGDLSFNEHMVNLLLFGLDWLKKEIFGGDTEAERESKDSLLKKINAFIEKILINRKDTAAVGVSPGAMTAGPVSGFRFYRIRLAFRENIFESGIDPLMIIEDLASLGEIIEKKTDRSRLPKFFEMDPEKCYLSWELAIKTTATFKEVGDVFLFVMDENEIDIRDVTREFIPDGADSVRDKKIGEILVEKGLITEDELDEVIQHQGDGKSRIGDLIVEKGYATENEVSRALNEQESIRKRIETGTVRVPTDRLDSLMNLLGEIVIGQSTIGRISDELDQDAGFRLKNALYSLDRTTREFQEQLMSIRMIPVGPTFEQFRRFVRDAGREMGKDILLEIQGKETELDKTVIEKIGDPLKHMIRNSIDHGIELPDERAAKGKGRSGKITLNAYHQEGNVFIQVSDDGKGLDRDRIRRKAEELGYIAEGEPVSDNRLFSFIFEPGFSTAETVGELSGRGVGMDVVKTNMEPLRGTIEIKSEENKGTTFIIKLPLTLAIIEGMLVSVGGNVYIIPLLSIIESLQPSMETVKTVEGKGELVLVRGEYISLVRLYEFFRIKSDIMDPCKALVVVVESAGEKVGLMVDDLIGQHQTVIKSLNTGITSSRAISGAAIMGDGTIALILDIHGMIGEITG